MDAFATKEFETLLTKHAKNIECKLEVISDNVATIKEEVKGILARHEQHIGQRKTPL